MSSSGKAAVVIIGGTKVDARSIGRPVEIL
jgi:hypothetical protein